MKNISLGLIGKTLKHSFSKRYFGEKFSAKSGKRELESLGVGGVKYDLFELKSIDKVTELIDDKDIMGFNVTIPYKQEIIPYITDIQADAKAIQAVNVVNIERDSHGKAVNIRGYNTDFIGFKSSLLDFLQGDCKQGKLKTLILGTGGAAKAIKYSLEQLQIPYLSVSRAEKTDDNTIAYFELFRDFDIIDSHRLIINTTPLGTYPYIDGKPSIPYSLLTKHHYLYDLVYNPDVTSFMREGISKGAKVLNGYNMLVGQAEASWEIWKGFL